MKRSSTTTSGSVSSRPSGKLTVTDTPEFARATELLLEAAVSAPPEGRPMYAALRAIAIPDDVVARMFHAASLLREHRGDGL